MKKQGHWVNAWVVIAIIAACCVGFTVAWLMHPEQGGATPSSASLQGGGVPPPTSLKDKARSPNAPSKPAPHSSDGIPAVDAMDSDAPVQDSPDSDANPREGELRMLQSADEVRQAIIGNAKLDDAQIAQLDKMIDGLNQQMGDVATKWAERIRASGTLDADTRQRMTHETSGVLVSFSDRLDGEFPGWRGEGKIPFSGEGVDASADGVVDSMQGGVDPSRLVRASTAFEPFRKLRSEILRGGMDRNRPQNQSNEGDQPQ